MVLPYLRNPRRRLQNQKQYHLEPDHADTYHTSTSFRHVGRRTYNPYEASDPYVKYGGGNGVTSQPWFWVFATFGAICLCSLFRVILLRLEMYLKANYPEEQQQTEEDEDAPQEIKERKQLIRSKLHYEIVLSDRSCIELDNLRGEICRTTSPKQVMMMMMISTMLRPLCRPPSTRQQRGTYAPNVASSPRRTMSAQFASSDFTQGRQFALSKIIIAAATAFFISHVWRLG